jgi:glucoamylase
VNTARSGKYKITKTYVTDPRLDTLLIDIKFESSTPATVYVIYDPSLKNSGMHDTAWTVGNILLSSDGTICSAVTSSNSLTNSTNGFLDVNDGLTQLRKSNRLVNYRRAANGNVVQTAELLTKTTHGNLTLALGFGSSGSRASSVARQSLARGFTQVQREYEAGWSRFVDKLPKVNAEYQEQFQMAAMVLSALEDKTYRGASIASPSIPWGGGPNANEPTVSGYHAVWSRDLYHVGTALLALGDIAGANRALDYLFQTQQKTDGSFPQNSWLNGKPVGGGVQMDQVALPLVLAYHLKRTDPATWRKHVKPAADYIVRNGPATGQDRWEEKPGYSPATIAAEIAGLVCAAHIARVNQDAAAEAIYLKTADDWAKNVERWCVTATGSYGDKNYYLRITANDDPNDGAKIEINSGGGLHDEREVVDAGFLELVRLGVKPADDPLIVKSIELSDLFLKRDMRSRVGWYRYNFDAYGEQPDGKPYDGKHGIGRLWTLLSGERGEYELARGDKVAAERYLRSMMMFANDGGMIPEQVWDRPESPTPQLRSGRGTGSATPLAWSMAQFIRLAINLKNGRNMDTPDIVMQRYLKSR